jgi:hypothetical protein
LVSCLFQNPHHQCFVRIAGGKNKPNPIACKIRFSLQQGRQWGCAFGYIMSVGEVTSHSGNNFILADGNDIGRPVQNCFDGQLVWRTTDDAIGQGLGMFGGLLKIITIFNQINTQGSHGLILFQVVAMGDQYGRRHAGQFGSKAAAEARGVLVPSAESFMAGRQAAPHAIRIGVGTHKVDDVTARKGIDILADILKSPGNMGPVVV